MDLSQHIYTVCIPVLGDEVIGLPIIACLVGEGGGVVADSNLCLSRTPSSISDG